MERNSHGLCTWRPDKNLRHPISGPKCCYHIHAHLVHSVLGTRNMHPCQNFCTPAQHIEERTHPVRALGLKDYKEHCRKFAWEHNNLPEHRALQGKEVDSSRTPPHLNCKFLRCMFPWRRSNFVCPHYCISNPRTTVIRDLLPTHRIPNSDIGGSTDRSAGCRSM